MSGTGKADRWWGKIALVVIAGGAGYALGQWHRSSVQDRQPEAAPASIRRAIPPTQAAMPRVKADSVLTGNNSAGEDGAGEWQRNWERVARQASTTSRGTALADLLAARAEKDPQGALTVALAEPNLVLRDVLIQGVLRGWARTAPADAAKWVYTLPDQAKRSAAMATVFASAAATQPEEAARIGRTMFHDDPGGATGYVGSLIEGLCANGKYELAVQLAGESGAVGPVTRSILTVQAYTAWATMEPKQAAQAAAALTDPAARTDAMNAVVSGWGQADPAGLTEFVAQLPAGPEQVPLLGQALRQWATIDSAAALQWVASHDVGSGIDAGAAAIAGAGFLAPNVSAAWAESIADPALRSQTMLSVLRNWAITDPEGAKRYFEKSTQLEPGERNEAAALFAPPGGS